MFPPRDNGLNEHGEATSRAKFQGHIFAQLKGQNIALGRIQGNEGRGEVNPYGYMDVEKC